jgi:carboxypeptidase PM20D1
MLINILVSVLAVVLFFTALMLVRTTQMMKGQPSVEEIEPIEVDVERAAKHLSAALQVPTVSNGHEPINLPVFQELHQMLEGSYPLVHQYLKREIISNATLLYTWEGTNPDLKPVLFAAHQDVVPAEEQTLDAWTYPPFSGEIAEGFIWGRGSLDIKSQMIAVFEAVEHLLAEGYKPPRTVLMGFGEDEEVGGHNGAKKIAEYLEAQGIHLAAMLDEGGSIMQGTVPGVDIPVALIGTAEKGHLSLKLRAEAKPGHSAMPTQDMAIGRLARALARLDARRMPVNMKALQDLFKGLGAATSFGMQFVFSNLWFFGPIARQQVQENPQTDATVRTTTALTIVQGGVKDNILPHSAEAIVNMRLLPGDTIAKTCERVRKIINDDQVHFEPVENAYWEASPVSSTDSAAFHTLSDSIRQVFDGVVVAPFLVLGATDARYYAGLSDSVYRFSPYQVTSVDIGRVHGIDERLSVEGMGKMVAFFVHLMRAWSGEDL